MSLMLKSVAELAGSHIEFVAEQDCGKSPTGKFPYIETADGVISQADTIA